jgi:potassium-transporting ATPase potassium-binding subunit
LISALRLPGAAKLLNSPHGLLFHNRLEVVTAGGLGQFLVFLVLLLAITKPLGSYMAKVFEGKRTLLSKPLLPLERLTYHWCGIHPEVEQTWVAYAGSCLAFGLVNFVGLYLLLRIQSILPLNPQHFGTSQAPPDAIPVTPDLAFNTAISFMTNTSWQSYAGEKTLSYAAQMLGIAAQSFTSTAAGMAVAAAVVRGFIREKTRVLGNFWVDLTRAIIYVLLPLSVLAGLVLCSLGVIQSFRPYELVTTLEGSRQTLPSGPVASQEAIKLLSAGDGGGFFNANSAHPYENPSPLSNFVEMLMILAIPAGMTYTFGRMVNNRKQGWTLFGVMTVLFVCGSAIIGAVEQGANPSLPFVGGNMEGKETRFGIAGSALFSEVSTASSDGAVNSMHSSFTPLASLIQMFNLTTGEVIFGGAGTGLVSIVLMAVLTVFIAGLMVGRTPEYLGKRIEAKEIKLLMLSYIAHSIPVLVVTAATLILHFRGGGYWNPPGDAVANLANHGAHGLTELLYANASAVATNGSAFAGLNANTPWFNLTTGLEMLIGRFLLIIPALAIAGSLARKPKMAVTAGTLPTHGLLFLILLVGSTVLVTALTFFPAFSLGPIVEFFIMRAGSALP